MSAEYFTASMNNLSLFAADLIIIKKAVNPVSPWYMRGYLPDLQLLNSFN